MTYKKNWGGEFSFAIFSVFLGGLLCTINCNVLLESLLKLDCGGTGRDNVFTVVWIMSKKQWGLFFGPCCLST